MEKVMESKFVVRDLKVYGTDEWMADGITIGSCNTIN